MAYRRTPGNPLDSAALTAEIQAAVTAASWTVNGIASQKKTSPFTAGLAELGKITECASGSAFPVTIAPTPTVAWPADAGMEFVQTGDGELSIVAGSGVTLRSATSPAGLKARSRWASVYVRRSSATPQGLDTTNLLLRYKADDISGSDLDAVSTWTGSGSSAGNATQATGANQPKLRTAALNGHKTVEFDGTNDMLALGGSALDVARNRSDIVVFVAYKMPGSAVANTRCLLALSTGTTTGARVAMYQNSSNVHTAAGRRLDADGFAQAASPSGSTTGEAAILTALYRWSTSDALLFKDGTQLVANTSFQTAGSTSDTASLTGFIGANAAGSAEWFSGQIAEILIYSGGDTDGTLRANVHTYLGHTYGITVADDLGVPDEWVVSGDTKA